MKYFIKILILNLLSLSLTVSNSFSEVVKDLKISGNNRISNETINMFTEINLGDEIDASVLNSILKNLYETNFFDNVSVEISNGVLEILVKEAPIINDIKIEGLKSKKIIELVEQNLTIKPRSSYNKSLLNSEVSTLKSKLRENGYFFTEIEALVETIDDDKKNIIYNINLGNKARIKKISFIGDKIFKDSKLKRIIVSEEYKFWKFLSGKKFLNENLIELDKRLIKNFYLNKGYYNIIVNTSFARLYSDNEFELIYNIDAKDKFYFGVLDISYPKDFDDKHFEDLKQYLKDIENKPYSINQVEKIIEKIEIVTLNEEYVSIKANAEESIELDKLNINFNIEETEKFFVEKINIYGNNITQESVIRNQLELDEGDPYNEILSTKSINNIKSLNFFKDVDTKVIEGNDEYSKVINIGVKEKPTGEISAGAGFGSDGASVAFGVKENNYLGKGLTLGGNATITEQTFKGKFSLTDPNFNNSDKAVFGNIQAVEIDQLKKFGYKTNKTGFAIGTDFEYLEDLRLGVTTSTFIEKLEANSTASATRKKQVGNYFDVFLDLDFDYDKRNQKFQTSEGFKSYYSVRTPLVSDNNTLTNTYDYKVFTELYEKNITSFNFFIQTANSLSGDDIKLTERLTLPSNKLRGFETGKVGPKDGADYIGGNYQTALNINSTLPQLTSNYQNLDALIFFDAANIWGIDYDSNINDGSKIRSSIGVGIDWFSIIGPMNFTLSQNLSKNSSDVTETFRFNIGTTF